MTTRIKIAAHFGQIAEFNLDQDNWDNYVEQLNFFFVADGITDANKKRAITLSSCCAVTYNLFKGSTAPSKTSEVSFDNLCKLMIGHKRPTQAQLLRDLGLIQVIENITKHTFPSC